MMENFKAFGCCKNTGPVRVTGNWTPHLMRHPGAFRADYLDAGHHAAWQTAWGMFVHQNGEGRQWEIWLPTTPMVSSCEQLCELRALKWPPSRWAVMEASGWACLRWAPGPWCPFYSTVLIAHTWVLWWNLQSSSDGYSLSMLQRCYFFFFFF